MAFVGDWTCPRPASFARRAGDMHEPSHASTVAATNAPRRHRGRRNIGTIAGEEPTCIVPSSSKP